MSDFCVMLVLKTAIYVTSKLLGFQNCASLELEHYRTDP